MVCLFSSPTIYHTIIIHKTIVCIFHLDLTLLHIRCGFIACTTSTLRFATIHMLTHNKIHQNTKMNIEHNSKPLQKQQLV